MKKSNLFGIFCACIFSFITIPSYASTFTVSGLFGDFDDMFGNLNAVDYPFPELYGGSFSGSFDYDPLSTPVNVNTSFTEYAMTSVLVDIIDSGGTTINTITNLSPLENNVFRLNNDGSGFGMIFGYSAGLIGTTEDLRLSFDSSAAFVSGFLETDGVDPFTFWDLAVISATTSVPAPAVPVPAAVWLFGSGLLGLVGLARRKEQLTANSE